MNETQSGAYRPLGRRLKQLRDRANETLAEASGAVEIDVKDLAGYELGQHRPSEEVLLLLISHFGVQDDEALALWELAGYSINKVPAVHMGNEYSAGQPGDQSDKRILFTDIVDIVVNNYGVVMNFMQSNGPAGKPSSVSRVGMSREHAKSVLKILKSTLSQAEQVNLNTDKKQDTPKQ